MRTLVVGAGAVGGYFGGRLVEAFLTNAPGSLRFADTGRPTNFWYSKEPL